MPSGALWGQPVDTGGLLPYPPPPTSFVLLLIGSEVHVAQGKLQGGGLGRTPQGLSVRRGRPNRDLTL